MTSTASTFSVQKHRVAPRTSDRTRLSSRRASSDRSRREHVRTGKRRALGAYTDSIGRARELVVRPGSGGSVLVLDRDARTLGDRRLVAHIAPDEPEENAAIVCGCYLTQNPRGRCRLLTPEDLSAVPFAVGLEIEVVPAVVEGSSDAQEDVRDRLGRGYRLERLSTGMSIPELRWCRYGAADEFESRPVSMREVIGSLEGYEPVRTWTLQALRRHIGDGAVSVAALRAELARMQQSPIVLNRGLRETVLKTVQRQGVSMSEIAIRCGRVKRDSAGNASGETSWLSRRLGLLPEGGRDRPTPWIHSDVLALIAREGLGVCPREVEVE